MRFLLPALILGTVVAACSTGANAETRCGYIDNPTPGNYSLTDADGEWIMRTQGVDQEPEGFDLIGDISAGDYRKTNGNYGYACGCLTVATEDSHITKITSFEQISMDRCEADPALPQRD